MSRQQSERVKRLEARQRPAGTVRHVWWEPGQPWPRAAPGEQLVVVSWESEPAAEGKR